MSKPTKVLWYDLETTGLHAHQDNGIIQIAYLIEIDGTVEDQGNFLVSPFPADQIQIPALDCNRRTLNEIRRFPRPEQVHKEITDHWGKYVDRYDKEDKFYRGGYNIGPFDNIFLKRWFEKCNDPYFGSWFNGMNLDARPHLHTMHFLKMINPPNHKLTTMCELFDISLQGEAHDALVDVIASRELYYKTIDSTCTDSALHFARPKVKEVHIEKIQQSHGGFLDDMEKRFSNV